MERNPGNLQVFSGLDLKHCMKATHCAEKSVHVFPGLSLSDPAAFLLALQTLHSSQSFAKSGL